MRPITERVREGVVDEERPPAGQVAVFIDFENLVLGAGRGLPGQANPVPYAALARLCREYGNASVRRAYADWADARFGRVPGIARAADFILLEEDQLEALVARAAGGLVRYGVAVDSSGDLGEHQLTAGTGCGGAWDAVLLGVPGPPEEWGMRAAAWHG
jgi:hypothetical protein